MTRKCAKCGVVSEIEEVFLKSYYSDKIFYCPECWGRDVIQRGESYLIACVAILIGGLVWVIIRPQNEFAWLIFQMGLFLSFISVVAVPHELGHVLAGFMTKAKILRVTIGLGRTLYKRDIFGIEWEFCAIPICGFTSAGFNNRKFYRLRSFLVSLGGPFMNLMLGVAALFVLFSISSLWLAAVIRAFIAANVFQLLYNLLPRKGVFAGTLTSSDGLTLLTAPFISESKINQNIEACYVWEGYGYYLKGRLEDAKQIYETALANFPDSIALQEEMGRILLDLGNYGDARNLFVQLQKNIEIQPAMAVRLLNDIATADVLMGTKELLDEADVFSQTACEKMPWQTGFKGTRGLVLAKKGHIEQGLTLLKEAMDKTDNSSHKAIYASYIAEFEDKKSNVV
jgi:hypothetical protein